MIPLVEIVPGEQTEPSAVADAVAFYKAIGKVPRVLRKEIQGFVANRLQRAIFRECCHLVLEGVVTVDELDDIVTSSIGLRWAADGPFRSFHLGGGPGGFVSFFRQFAPGMEAAWKSQAAVTLDAKSQQTIIDQAQASFAATPPEKLEGERDAKQLAILKALAAVRLAGMPAEGFLKVRIGSTRMSQLMFKGLKVLDCSSFIAAPAAATILSDFGADVIKIEPPGAGDPYRSVPLLPTMPQAKENYAWMLASRNKRGLALNLAKPAAREVARRLVAQTDVFITNFPAVVRKKLGLRYEDLAPLNDRLIYASFTGYGEVGEEASKPGFRHHRMVGRSGLMDGVRTEATAPPARSLTGMGDHPSGISLYAGIVMGLYQRQLTGKGAHVGTSLLANGIWCNGVMAQAALCGAQFIDRPPREQALNAFTNYYQCRDGRWLILTILNEERQWPVFIKCLGREDLQNDPRFATSRDRMTARGGVDHGARQDVCDQRPIGMARNSSPRAESYSTSSLRRKTFRMTARFWPTTSWSRSTTTAC